MIRETRRRQTRRGIRVWFGCDDCGTSGDLSGSTRTVDGVLTTLIEGHRCEPTEVRR